MKQVELWDCGGGEHQSACWPAIQRGAQVDHDGDEDGGRGEDDGDRGQPRFRCWCEWTNIKKCPRLSTN